MVGRTLAHYRILEKIGSGGMGDVYLAEDTKLDRRVALKVLPPEVASSGERRARFEREAKAVAALNHPNIVTVHSVEESDGVHFITMELVKGKSVAELLPKKGFSLDRFFEIATPLADAVAAAHDRGIVHRDLKPSNLMWTDDHRVKVLDFGLAKIAGGGAGIASELPTEAKTGEGVVVGTVSYMSPEQAEGKTVDHRTDIFSLGIILYELATGERPFCGESTASVLSAILKDTPVPVTELKPELPTELSKIVRRCLVKDVEHRYQSAKDVRNELEELKRDMDSGSLVSPVPPREARRARSLVAVLGLALVALEFGAWFFSRPRARRVPRLGNPVQLTSAIGVEDHPTWSPDGRMIAYESRQTGNWDIWVTQIGEGQPVNRTVDFAGLDRFPSWSPDGSTIAFVSEREGGCCFVMPAIGGDARRAKATNWLEGVPQWSPDGRELACIVDENGTFSLDIVDVRIQESRRLPLSSFAYELSWSPNGRFFAYSTGEELFDTSDVRVLRVADGHSYGVTDGRTRDRSPSWSADSRKLYFVSNRGGNRDLWQQSLTADGEPQGVPQPITVGIDMRSAAFSPDGTQLAYSRGRQVANVWRVPIFSDRPATWKDATQLTFDQATVEFMDESPDGKWLAVNSDPRGNHDLWILPVEGGEMRQLTFDPTGEWRPSWSPDGKQIAFFAYRSGNRDIWVMPAEGGPWYQITRDEVDENNERWSPDGRNIVFQKNQGLNADIWVASLESTEERRLTDHPASDARPDWSPDGKWVVFDSYRDGSYRLWRVRPEGGDAEQVTKGPGLRPFFSNDGKRVYYWGSEDGGDFWEVSITEGNERPLTDLQGRLGQRLFHSVSRDGKSLYFTWREDLGDIWVMDVVDRNE